MNCQTALDVKMHLDIECSCLSCPSIRNIQKEPRGIENSPSFFLCLTNNNFSFLMLLFKHFFSYQNRYINTFHFLESRSGEVYSIQHYVIKFVSDLRHVSGFLRVFRFPPSIKLTATI